MSPTRYTLALILAPLLACGDAARPPSQAPASPARTEAADAGAAPNTTPAGDTPVEITGEVGGRALSVRGLGACEHAADASIYMRPASLWTVRFEGAAGEGLERLNLAFWRERSGAESVNLGLGVGSEEHRIATVEGGTIEGRARATLAGDATAGVLEVEGTTGAGAPLRLRVRCERFTTLVAEGG